MLEDKRFILPKLKNVLMQIDYVIDATVKGESNPIVGNIIVAKLSITFDKSVSVSFDEEGIKRLKRGIRSYCKKKLENYKVPVKITIVNNVKYSDRYKKIRK